MAKQILTSLDLLSLPSLTTPKTGSVGFGAKSDGLYQKIGAVETKLSVDGHTHTIAQITGLQGALDSKATQSDIDTAVNNLQIGGRNLILNTSSEWVVYPQFEGWYGGYPVGTVAVEPNTQYTLRSYIKMTNPIEGKSIGTGAEFFDVNNKHTFFVQGGFVDEEGYSSITFVTDANTVKMRMHFRTNNWKIGATNLSYKEIKLEKGNKATDWTPAPEDQVSDWNVTDASSFSFIKNKPTQLSQFTDNIGVASHIANKANPHNVTKAQVGLGNVDNVKQATKSEFDTHTSNSTIHITSTERTNWNLAYTQRHTHGNKSVIDALTQGHINVLNKLSLDEQGNVKVDATLWATGGLSAYGLGVDGGSGGGGIDRLDSWANYTTEKADYYVPASLLVPFRNDTLSRLDSLESGSATSIVTTGSGNAITSVSKSGNTLTFAKGSTFSLSTHNHDTIYKPIGYVPSWSEITGKPSTFAPSSHTHTIANVTGLQSALDGKQPNISTGTTSQYYRGDKTWQTLNTSVVPEGANLYFTNARVKAYGDTLYSPLGHTHTITQITGLQGALDSKAVGGMTVDFTSTASLNNTLNGLVSGMAGSPISGSSVVGFWTTLESNKNYGGGFFTRLGRAFTLTKENGVIQSWQELAYLTSNVASATKLQTARTINGTSFNGTANITTANWGTARNIGIVNSDGTGTAVTTSVNGSANVNLKLPSTIKASLTGNADTATKLQTARTIAGVSFDGSANIAIPFANLASKPTTLSGYGITDGVTTNTTQTITGAKTFSALLTAIAGVNTPKVIFAAAGWSLEQVGTELQMKYNGVVKQRMLSDGSIVATGELTAYVAAT